MCIVYLYVCRICPIRLYSSFLKEFINKTIQMNMKEIKVFSHCVYILLYVFIAIMIYLVK